MLLRPSRLLQSRPALAAAFAFAIFAFSTPVFAATSVSWTAPADGSSFPTGTIAMPTGVASASGSSGPGLDLVLVMDSSGSMSILATSGGVTKSRQQFQKDAALALVDGLANTGASNISISVVEFDSSASLVTQLTPLTSLANRAQIEAAINSVDASGGTTIGSGIAVATTELTSVRADQIGRSQQMIVLSDGDTFGNPATNAAAALLAGVENVHSVAMPGANLTTMQAIATAGNGTFVDVSSDIGDLTAALLTGGTVGIDKVEVTLPDGTVVEVPVGIAGNFTSPSFALEDGPNTFIATAFGTDGSQASAPLTLFGSNGTTAPIPEPGAFAVFGLGLFVVARRRMPVAVG